MSSHSDLDAANRTPVIVGVGEVNDRADVGTLPRSAIDLMVEALRVADRDAGGKFISLVDTLYVVRALTAAAEPHADVAAALHIEPAIAATSAQASGESPLRLLNDAANMIASGRARVVAITGGESMAGNPAASLDPIRAALQSAPPLLKKYNIVLPISVYPFYEHATRAKWQQTMAQSLQESAELAAAMSRVAVENPNAWLRKAYSPAEVTGVSADNPMLNFPYTRRMVANSKVSQGAALMVTSLAQAIRANIPLDRIVFVGAGASAHESDDYLLRPSYDDSAGMHVSLTRTLSLNGLRASDLDHVELYSCFPCIPKMARRIIGWELDRPASVYGGLTFGGGPIANCMAHAIAAMVRRMRVSGEYGLVFGNGGFATHNHSIVLSRRQPPRLLFPQEYDYTAEAEKLHGSVPTLIEAYAGPGVIETYTVPYGRDGKPAGATVIARTPAGERFVASVEGDDINTLSLLTSLDREPVGSRGHAFTDESGRVRWTVADR
jgi:acetyl-CoA C-acetyltransferase